MNSFHVPKCIPTKCFRFLAIWVSHNVYDLVISKPFSVMLLSVVDSSMRFTALGNKKQLSQQLKSCKYGVFFKKYTIGCQGYRFMWSYCGLHIHAGTKMRFILKILCTLYIDIIHFVEENGFCQFEENDFCKYHYNQGFNSSLLIVFWT